MRRRSVSRAKALLPLRPLPAGAVVWAGALAAAAFGLTLADAQTLPETAKPATHAAARSFTKSKNRSRLCPAVNARLS